jgi:hypothetical protein
LKVKEFEEKEKKRKEKKRKESRDNAEAQTKDRCAEKELANAERMV